MVGQARAGKGGYQVTVFELVRQEVTAEAAARLYGLRFDRGGRGFCPWHDDGKHPALKFLDDGNCYCHSCHASGDATAITAQMLGLTPKQAAERIRTDFHLDTPTSSRPDPTTKVKTQQRQEQRDVERRRWSFLCNVVHQADEELTRYSQETAWDNPRFVAVLRARARADEQLNIMWEKMLNERT